MAPSNFDKDETDREYLRDEINFLDTQLSSHSKTPLTKAQAAQSLQQIEEIQKSLANNHSSIRHHAPKGTDMTALTTDYFTLRSQASRIYSGFHGIVSSFPPDPATPPATSTTHSSSSKQGIKLPPLVLPKFNGNLQEWVPFRDMFKAAVHNSSLSKVEKLTQLNSLLTGEAARQVRSLVLSDTNYDIAWQALQDRYENNRELLFSILKRLFTHPPLNSSSAVHLRGLIDTTKECIRQLEVLSLPTNHWDAVIIYNIFSKLDPASRELWEQSLPDTSIPSLTKFYDFLEQRARALAVGGTSSTTRPPPVSNYRPPPRQDFNRPPVKSHHLTAPPPCKLGCTQPHVLFRCPTFYNQTPSVRNTTIKQLKHCLNCLSPGHSTAACPSTHRCKVCSQPHHTMLHTENNSSRSTTISAGNPPTLPPQTPPLAQQPTTRATFHYTQPLGQIRTGVLATAKVTILSPIGTYNVRSLLDPGTTNTSITEDKVRALQLPVRRCNIPLTGLDETNVGFAKYVTAFEFAPHFNSNVSYTVQALVVKSIGGNIPSERLQHENWNHVQGLQLADPLFFNPAKVDILFGTDIFWQTLGQEKILGAAGQPMAISSSLGWLIAGENNSSTPIRVFHLNAQLDLTLQKFWEQETIDEETISYTQEEQLCEQHFKQTHRRDPATGTFIVQLPFKTPRPELGSSRQLALKRFLSMERKFTHPRNADSEQIRKLTLQWQEYIKFMREYEALGHMIPVPTEKLTTSDPVYYIPHHSVLKESSTTTKLRVVFDASASTTSGHSLNDCLLTGAKLQDNLPAIITRSRFYKIMFTSVIAKMYRMISLADSDWNYQRILWREQPSQPLKEYWLTTVTYGTTSAPHHAVRCLQQLAQDHKQEFPEAAVIAARDFYVDDNCSGSDDLETAKNVVHQLILLAQRGGFELRKWTSNSPELLATIPENLRETNSLIEVNTDNNSVKTLGLVWNTTTDSYHFKLNTPPAGSGKHTKRTILSDIARIFDPLGWLAPVIISCKIIMQELWSIKAGWDEALPAPIVDKWIHLSNSLQQIDRIAIPRCVNPSSSKDLILIGCCDASLKAISACTYVMDPSANTCHLLEAKTKVAPLKHVTLPRLELNSAVLLSTLVKSLLTTVNKGFREIRFFTDSMIAYHWISSSPQRWEPFIRRRVQTIQDNVPEAKWFHIPGTLNPADCASRGISAEELSTHRMWWSGSEYFWNPSFTPELLEEEQNIITSSVKKVTTCHHIQPSLLHPIFNKYSSFQKLTRVVSYIFRFMRNWNHRRFGRDLEFGTLTVREIQISQNLIFRHVQQHCFPQEYQALSKGHPLSAKSNILSLRPFLYNGILRVGGRIRHASVPFNTKHQLLLPGKHHVTSCIITDTHLQNLHSGPASTLAVLQQQYWIINGRDRVRYTLKQCVVCTRFRASTMKQLMGDLPIHRVTHYRPFSKVGVDYAGPFLIRPMVRSKVTLKCWLSVFVCFTTRALHVEVVSSLTTDCFLAALKRFTSRRGLPSDIFSDCGTNFKGAEKVLNDLLLLSQSPAVQDAVASQHIKWHFNPAGAPHFGGLWEAGVKSIKHHLYRVMGASRLTYEEFSTLVIQIEGILNSRPLVPASTDPSDLSALTPAHFLIGTEMAAVPERDLIDERESHLRRWQKMQKLQQQFWTRWSKEFLTRLQQRPKWLKEETSISMGNLVLIKDERAPPLRWKLGRVIALHPGQDGLVRVATLKTPDGELKRPITKLSLLPIISNTEQ